MEIPSSIKFTNFHDMELENSGDSYFLNSGYGILFENTKLYFVFKCRINEDIIPHTQEGEILLREYFSNNEDYEIIEIDDETDSYFDSIPYAEFETMRANKFIPGMQSLDDYQSDILTTIDGERVERDCVWFNYGQTGPGDLLTYFIKDQSGFFSEYIIEINASMQRLMSDEFEYQNPNAILQNPKIENRKVDDEWIFELYTLTNNELDQISVKDPSVDFLYLMNDIVETFSLTQKAYPDFGICNDDRVRVRSDNSLNSDTLGHVNTGEGVIILDRSENKQKIGDMEDYWYKILSKTTYIKGWMYGAFLGLK